MPYQFDESIVSGVLHHMNDEHSDDNLLIARAFSDAAADGALMLSFNGDGGRWAVTVAGVETEVEVPWPGGPISERAEVRREIVALYDASCARLGIAPRDHE